MVRVNEGGLVTSDELFVRGRQRGECEVYISAVYECSVTHEAGRCCMCSMYVYRDANTHHVATHSR